MRAYNTGVGHTDKSTQYFWLGKTLTNFSCVPDRAGVQTSGLWISSNLIKYLVQSTALLLKVLQYLLELELLAKVVCISGLNFKDARKRKWMTTVCILWNINKILHKYFIFTYILYYYSQCQWRTENWDLACCVTLLLTFGPIVYKNPSSHFKFNQALQLSVHIMQSQSANPNPKKCCNATDLF